MMKTKFSKIVLQLATESSGYRTLQKKKTMILWECEMNTYTDHQRQHDNLYCRLPFHTCQGSITNMHPAVLQTRGCGQPWVEAGAVCLSHKASRSRTINFLCCGQHPISSSSEILTWHSSGRHKTRSVTLALGSELSAVTVLWFLA